MKKLFICLVLLFGVVGFSSCGGEYVMYDNFAPEMEELYNSEEYIDFIENPFIDASVTPKSVFSLDSSTYSYSNLRRLIQNGENVPSNAVNIEHMLNYFNYSYTNDTNEALSSTLELAVCPWNEEHYVASVAVKAKDFDLSDTKNNFVFLVDVSGSMDYDNKLSLFQESFKILMDQLGENDTISIVTYASGVRTIIDGVNGDNKKEIVGSVTNLTAGGSTNGSGGIQRAYQLAEKHFISDGNNRVFIATDGDFNVGISSTNELEEYISSKRDRGIYLSIFGFGVGNTKHNKMETLALHGDGNAYYIDSLLEAKKVFVNELGGTLNTVAKDSKAMVEFNPSAVKKYRLLGYENKLLSEEDFENEDTDAGEIGAGHTTIAMYEIIPNEKFSTSDFVFKSILRYKDAQTFENKEVINSINKLITSSNLEFATCVVEFALVLRNSQYKADASYDNLISRINEIDLDGDYFKEEFKQLVLMASGRW